MLPKRLEVNTEIEAGTDLTKSWFDCFNWALAEGNSAEEQRAMAAWESLLMMTGWERAEDIRASMILPSSAVVGDSEPGGPEIEAFSTVVKVIAAQPP